MDYLLTFFFLAFAHHFSWDFLPWRMPHPIRLIINYVIGTVGMLAPFIWWLFEKGETEIISKLIGFVIAAGLAPVLTHWNDHLIAIGNKAVEKNEETELLKKQLDTRRDEA